METANKANPKPVTIHRVYELDRNFDDREHYKEGERSLYDAYLIEFFCVYIISRTLWHGQQSGLGTQVQQLGW